MRLILYYLLNRFAQRCSCLFVKPGTTIISDCWKAYSRIDKLGKEYKHMIVNHDLHFVDPKTGAYTNAIESIWCSAKVHIKGMRGISRKYLNSYLGNRSIFKF